MWCVVYRCGGCGFVSVCGVHVCGCMCGVGMVCMECVDEMYSICTWGHVQLLVPHSIEQAGAELSAWAGP